MTNDGKKLFIEILKNYIGHNNCIIGNDYDYSTIKDYAYKHQLQAIFYKQTRNDVFKSAYFAQIYNYANICSIIDEINLIFKDIDFFLVKGVCIAQLYPDPELRSMGDIDIIARKDDREKLHKLLLSNGFINTHMGNQEWKYLKRNYTVELHHALLYKEKANNNQLVDYCEQFWNHRSDNSLDWNYHFIYLILHMRKHFFTEGIGFRQFMDVAIICKKVTLDWNFIGNEFSKLGLLGFLKIVLALNKYWFDILTPLSNQQLEESFLEDATNLILENGVFGFQNTDNVHNRAINVAVKSGKMSMMGNYISAIFLPYNKLKNMEEYSFIDGKAYLTPYVWVKRICKKWHNRENIRNRYLASDKQISKRIDLLNKWKL